MEIVLAILVTAGGIAGAAHYLEQLPDDVPACHPRWLRRWAGRGIGLPALAWICLNGNLVPGFPPLIQNLGLARPGTGAWMLALAEVSAAALVVIATCWGAVTLGWLAGMIRAHAPPEDRREFWTAVVLWTVLLGPVGLAVLYAVGWPGVGLAVCVPLLPIVHTTLPLAQTRRRPPGYSRAIARMKFGKSDEAEWEILRELEQCEDDFNGWMLLAELYATHFRDLAVADQTVRELCDQPNVNASQIDTALQRLADWHLKIGGDPVAARRALVEICHRFPGTHLERMARLRLDQLPATREALREQNRPRTIRLPASPAEPMAPAATAGPPLTRDAAARQANQLVEQLQGNPDDVPAREKLACLLADPLGKVEAAIEQLELLLAMPGQPEKKSAEWLSRIAGWQAEHLRDAEAARRTLERLTREHPQTPEAFAAQRRLNLLAIEQRFRRARTAVPPRE